MEGHNKRRDALNKKRWRQLITPHSKEIKWSDREARERGEISQTEHKQNITSTRFFMVILWFLISAENMTVNLTPDRHGRRRQADTQRLMAPHATHATLADYPRCLYSHMRSVWILNSSKNMCQPSPICLSPRHTSTIAHTQLMKKCGDVPI